MLPPDTVGFILYVIATLVAYLLFHFYKNPINGGSNPSGNSPSKKKYSPKGSLNKSGKPEQYAPVTGNRSADKILSSGRRLNRQQSETSLTNTPSKWFSTQEGFERYFSIIIYIVV